MLNHPRIAASMGSQAFNVEKAVPDDATSAHPWFLRGLHSLQVAQIDDLAEVLIDCVEGGSGLSFMHSTPVPGSGCEWQFPRTSALERR